MLAFALGGARATGLLDAHEVHAAFEALVLQDLYAPRQRKTVLLLVFPKLFRA